MAERYAKLFSLPENLYEKDCPVMICAGALSKDNQTDKVFVQLRFQNIDSRYRTIVAVKVALQPFGIAHNPLGSIKEYQYLDINTERGAEAGSKQPVYLDNNTARSFSASVLEVVFEDGSVWTGNAQNWSSLQQTKLSDKFSDDLMKQYQRDTFAEAKYEPFTKDGIWMCACGALNAIEDSKCCRCHNDKVKQFTALDHNTLSSNFQDHADKELEELKKEQSEGKKRKKKAVGLCCIIAILICICLSIPSIILRIQCRPYVSQLKDTSWWAIGNTTYYFDGRNNVQVLETSGTYKGKWKIVDLDTRWYSYYKDLWDYESVSLSGEAMRICVTYNDGRYNNEVYFDVFLEDDETGIEYMIINPSGKGGSTTRCTGGKKSGTPEMPGGVAGGN